MALFFIPRRSRGDSPKPPSAARLPRGGSDGWCAAALGISPAGRPPAADAVGVCGGGDCGGGDPRAPRARLVPHVNSAEHSPGRPPPVHGGVPIGEGPIGWKRRRAAPSQRFPVAARVVCRWVSAGGRRCEPSPDPTATAWGGRRRARAARVAPRASRSPLPPPTRRGRSSRTAGDLFHDRTAVRWTPGSRGPPSTAGGVDTAPIGGIPPTAVPPPQAAGGGGGRHGARR